jgi:hypothetical protein
MVIFQFTNSLFTSGYRGFRRKELRCGEIEAALRHAEAILGYLQYGLVDLQEGGAIYIYYR